MDPLLRPILLFATGAVAITAAAMLVGWWMEPSRRAMRVLASRLGGQLDAVATAPRRGQGVGIRVSPPGIAVVRRPGDLGLAFGFEEVLGAELIFDGEVRARAFRDEPRRPLDITHPSIRHLSVRLVFDDIRYPDFELILVHPDDPQPDTAGEMEIGRRLFAHLEAVIRQPRTAPAVTRPPDPPAPVGGPYGGDGDDEDDDAD